MLEYTFYSDWDLNICIQVSWYAPAAFAHVNSLTSGLIRAVVPAAWPLQHREPDTGLAFKNARR